MELNSLLTNRIYQLTQAEFYEDLNIPQNIKNILKTINQIGLIENI